MSKFPTNKPEEEPKAPSGRMVSGAFECDVCYQVVTTAIYNMKEERLYWDCPEGHNNNIPFKM